MSPDKHDFICTPIMFVSWDLDCRWRSKLYTRLQLYPHSQFNMPRPKTNYTLILDIVLLLTIQNIVTNVARDRFALHCNSVTMVILLSFVPLLFLLLITQFTVTNTAFGQFYFTLNTVIVDTFTQFCSIFVLFTHVPKRRHKCRSGTIRATLKHRHVEHFYSFLFFFVLFTQSFI